MLKPLLESGTSHFQMQTEPFETATFVNRQFFIRQRTAPTVITVAAPLYLTLCLCNPFFSSLGWHESAAFR